MKTPSTTLENTYSEALNMAPLKAVARELLHIGPNRGEGPLGPFGAESGPGRAPWAPWGRNMAREGPLGPLGPQTIDFAENSGSKK